ncbi:MAG: hypothetical protein RIR12_2648 [Bacteroidota bacterium]|jgi:hypothetical protein
MKYQVLFKYLSIAIALFLSGCSRLTLVQIIPLSPYEQVVSYNEGDKTIQLTYALKNYQNTKKNKAVVDSFILKKLPIDFLAENKGILFLFYKYEKGHIDENFIHEEQPKQKNLFMEANAELLISYEWSHGKFISVSYFSKGQYRGSEKRDWR